MTRPRHPILPEDPQPEPAPEPERVEVPDAESA